MTSRRPAFRSKAECDRLCTVNRELLRVAKAAEFAIRLTMKLELAPYKEAWEPLHEALVKAIKQAEEL